MKNATTPEEQLIIFNTPSKSKIPELSIQDFSKYTDKLIPIGAKSVTGTAAENVPDKKTSQEKVEFKERKWFIVRENKSFGPYNKKTLAALYKAKKITTKDILLGEKQRKKTSLAGIFPPKKKVAGNPSPHAKVLKMAVSLALADGILDDDELLYLQDFCTENDLDEKILDETITFMKGDGPPPAALVDDKFTLDDFIVFIKLANADGNISGVELRLLKQIFNKLQPTEPTIQDKKLSEVIKIYT